MNSMNSKDKNSALFLSAFTVGLIDVSSFLIFDIFVGFPLGNSILSMIYLSEMNWQLLINSTLAIFSFFCGTLVCYLINKKSEIKKYFNLYVLSFCLITTLFLYLFFSLAYISIFALSFFSGFINLLLNKDKENYSILLSTLTGSCIGSIIIKLSAINNNKIIFGIMFFILGGITSGYMFRYSIFSKIAELI